MSLIVDNAEAFDETDRDLYRTKEFRVLKIMRRFTE